MTTIESGAVEIRQSSGKLFNFLCDFNHFQRLLPPQISEWQSTGDTCSFNIQGMATLELRITEKIASTSIRMVSEGKTPVSIELHWTFSETEANTCLINLNLATDMSTMLLMMARSPLQNLVNLLVQKLKELAESDQL